MRRPCPTPRLLPELSRALWRLRRGRRAHRWACAVALGVLLTYQHEERAPGASPPSAEPEDAPTPINALEAEGGPLPRTFPDNWKRAPCTRGENVREIRGHCFVVLGKAPCDSGHTVNGECVIPMTVAPKPNTSIQR